MKAEAKELSHVITGMRVAYARGENAMAWARAHSNMDDRTVSALIAYDLQAGTYVQNARNDPAYIDSWSAQMAGLLDPYLAVGDRIMEAGVGEATTLAGLMKAITAQGISAYGFDLSWSRISVAQKWMEENSVKARLFVGDLFSIPVADGSIDVVGALVVGAGVGALVVGSGVGAMVVGKGVGAKVVGRAVVGFVVGIAVVG
jgi:hypothetical protein